MKTKMAYEWFQHNLWYNLKLHSAGWGGTESSLELDKKKTKNFIASCKRHF